MISQFCQSERIYNSETTDQPGLLQYSRPEALAKGLIILSTSIDAGDSLEKPRLRVNSQLRGLFFPRRHGSVQHVIAVKAGYLVVVDDVLRLKVGSKLFYDEFLVSLLRAAMAPSLYLNVTSSQ